MIEVSSPLISVRVAGDGTYVSVRMLGEHTFEMAKTATAALQEFIVSSGLNKVLIDAREQRKMFGTLPTVEFGDALEAEALPHRRFAIVVSMPLRDVWFTETVLVNRRITARYFNDYDQARAWLGVAPNGQEDRHTG